MTEEQIAENKRKRNNERSQRYRDNMRRNDPEYWQKRAEYAKQYREKQKQQKLGQPEEKSNRIDMVMTSSDVQPFWRSPSLTVVLAESRKLDRAAVIESLNGTNHLRLKIIVMSNDFEALKVTAHRMGFNNFSDTPITIKTKNK